MCTRTFAAGCSATFLVLSGAVGLGLTANHSSGATVQDAGNGAPEFIELQGIVRDFHERTHEDGHPDFERRPDNGFGHYAGNISPQLGDDGKPVYTGGGNKVSSQWLDSAGRPICYTLYDPDLGDVEGSWGASDDGGIESAESFRAWFHDSLGENLSITKTVTLRFHRQEDGSYVFDDKDDALYSQLGGFFPIEDELFGNPGGSPDRNFHFTFELHTQFTYDADGAQVFEFIGDDDVWVFINGQMVIDLGGVHAATRQYVDLNRLGLEDGQMYDLDFFFAERHRTQSNFRIVTNLLLDPEVTVATVSPVFD